MKKIITTLIGLLWLAVVLLSCDPGTGSQGDGDDTVKGDISKPTLAIPAALTSGTDRATTDEDDSGYFEPFRASLAMADNVLDHVYDIIDAINANVIPETQEMADGDGWLSISTDAGREYSKRIEWKSSETADPYMQVNYNPGTVKGEVYFISEDAAEELDRIKVFYDETGDHPVLKGWLTIKSSFIDKTDDETDWTTLYFKGTKNDDGQILFEGGLGYDFVLPGETSGLTGSLQADRTYMYRALCSSDGSRAEVALYFPDSETDTLELTSDHDLKTSWLQLMYDWLAINSYDFETGFEGGYGLNTVFDINLNPANYGLTEALDASITTTAVTDGASFEEALLLYSVWAEIREEEDPVADWRFILGLTNTIAYSAANGYEGNTGGVTEFPSDFDQGDPEAIPFTLTPSEIAGLTAADLAMGTD